MAARSREFPKITTLRGGWGQLFPELPAPRGVTPTTLKKFSYQLRSINFRTYQFGASVEYFQIFIPASSSYTGYFSNLGWYETGVYYIPAGYMGRYIVGVQYIIPGMKLVYQMVHGYTHPVRFLATHVDGWYQFWDPAHVLRTLKPFLGEGHYQITLCLVCALIPVKLSPSSFIYH